MNQPLYESFTVYEPFGGTHYDQNDIKFFSDLSTNMLDISNNLDAIQKIYDTNEFEVDYKNPKENVTTSDALKHDLEYMMAQQKNTYMIGMVSIATLIIATAYVVGKYS